MVYSVIKVFVGFLMLGTLFASTCLAEVGWTLHPSVHGIDGHTAPYVTSKLGANEITYIPPLKWTVSGGRFIPPGKVEADAYIDAVPIPAPAPWTPDRARALQDAVLSKMIPKGASKAAIVSEGVMPVQIAGESTYEICFSYNLYAQTYMESLAIVDHGQVELQIHMGSLKDDFPSLHAAFVGSLLTVQVL